MASGSREDRDREAKLREASKEGRKDDIIQLLKQGVDVNGADDEGWSSLMWASERGHVECVKMLLEGGAQANQHSNHGWTSLMGASRRGHVDCIKMLLEGGANANQLDNWGRTSLIDASEGGHVECIRILLEGGALANQQDRDGMTSLLYASRERHVECTRVLLEGGAQANLPNLDGMTSLMYASREGDVECTRVLLEGGAKANQQDKREVTALMEASYNGHVECTRVLLKGGAEAHLQNGWGRTSLIDASEWGHVECIRILLEGGAQAYQQDRDGMTSLMYASRQGHVECTRVLLEGGAKANQQANDGDTALHIAMRFGKSDCVRTLLSHPGMDPNIKNKKGLTAMNVQPCAYGKVMLCGHSGAGKSTLVEVILQRSLPTVTQLKKRLFGADEVEPLTAGIIPYQIDHSSMIIYDLAGQQQFFSSHSAYLEAMSPYSPAIFLLLHDLRKDPDDITKELHHWAAMIDGVCHKCPTKSSVIVVGTHADLLKKQQVSSKLADLKSKSLQVITHQNLVDVVTLNLKQPYSTQMEQFKDLLTKTNKAVISMCPPIPGHCPLLLNFLKVKLPPDAHAISLSDLHARITGDKDMRVMDPQLSTIIQSLKILSGRGLIALILSDDPPNNSWVVLQKECILKKVNGTLFADPNLKEYRQLSSNTGIIPKAVLRKAFPDYDVEMIAQFMIQFEMCQLVDLSKIDTNMKAEGSDLGPLLFFPALVREDRPSSVIVPENSFRWHMIVKSPHQFFTPRFHDVLLHRLTLQFPLPAVQATSSLSPQCEVWKNGIKWLSDTGVTTIVEMDGIPFQSLSLAMSFPHPKCHNLFHLVLNTIKTAFKEFCPYLDAVELVSFPSKDGSEIRVELSRLQDTLRSGDMSIIDESRNRPVNIAEWLAIEPCLPRFIGVKDCPQYHRESTTICDKHPAVMEGDLPGVEAKGSAGEDQAVYEGDISSEDCHAKSPPTPSEDQTSHPPTLSDYNILHGICCEVYTIELNGNGCIHKDERHGFSIIFPSGVLLPNQSITLTIGVMLYGPFMFPEGIRPISPIIYVSGDATSTTDLKLLKDATVILPHYLDIDEHDENQFEILFLKARNNHYNAYNNKKHKYLFELMGNATLLNDHKAAFSTSHFCSLCLAARVSESVKERSEFLMTIFFDNNNKYYFVVSYCLKTCSETLKKHFNHMIKVQSYSFKCNNSSLTISYRHVSQWLLTLIKGKEGINLAELDVWNTLTDIDTLKWKEDEGLYFPSFVLQFKPLNDSAQINNILVSFPETKLLIELPLCVNVPDRNGLACYAADIEGMPTIKLLTSLPSHVGGVRKNLNIIQRTSTSCTKLGMYLLDDDNCDIVDALREKYHHDPVEIVTAVYKKWISGTGRQPATWQTLVGVLRDIEVNALADDIEATLGNGN